MILSCVVATAFAAVDYCEVESRLCNGKPHIGCNNDGVTLKDSYFKLFLHI